MFGQLLWLTVPAWENQAQEIHRMKGTKIAHTVNVRKPEETANVRSKCYNATCPLCMLMNKLDQSNVTALGFKHKEYLTAM